MRLIDADALIAKWEEEVKYIEVFDHRGMVYGAINDVKRQPTIEVPRWIPVTERLPEKEGNYLVCDFHGNIFINYFWVVSAEWSVRCHIISAWMPLPKPWEGGEA